MIKKIKTRGYTDKLYFANLCFAWIYTIISIVLCYILVSIEKINAEAYCSMCGIIGGLVWAELGVHTGFVIHKAKVENLSKFAGKKVTENASMNINMDI